jgi:hypothetical protein
MINILPKEESEGSEDKKVNDPQVANGSHETASSQHSKKAAENAAGEGEKYGNEWADDQ